MVVLLGLLANKWAIEAALVPDAHIESVANTAILVLLQLWVITAGAWLLIRGRDKSSSPATHAILIAGLSIAILAAGFLPEVPAAIAGPMGLDLDEQGRPRVDELNQTDVPNIFAAGDLVTGAGYVVTAIDSARRAATQIDDYLRIARQA